MNVLTIYVDGKTFNAGLNEAESLEGAAAQKIFETVSESGAMKVELIDESFLLLSPKVQERCIFHARAVSETAKAYD
jgi:hypothetical protein